LRFVFIFENKGIWAIETQCRVLEVTRAAYYKWASREVSVTKQTQVKIVTEVKRIHSIRRFDDYGSPRLCRELVANGIQCSKNTVAKLMRQAGIAARTKPKFRVSTTDSNHEQPIAPNLLDQCFVVSKLNCVWLTDFTYVPTLEGFTYLCTIEDLCSRKIVGWATSTSIDTSLALAALNQAIALRCPEAGLILHSDRGSQFASLAYRDRLVRCNYLQSMSRKGNCYDNAPMESFFKSYKSEEVNRHQYQTHEHATRGVIDYIERFYNPVRLHSSLDYVSPNRYEEQLTLDVQKQPA
jgi:putative transposase